MLMAVKNQIKVSFLSIKYSLLREMLNRVTFFSNIIFMILNNASFIIQWLVLYSLKDGIGGYSFKEVMLLWGITAGTFGISHFFFKKAYDLYDLINTGKLDSYIVQPKNVLLSAICSDIETSAIGDILYAFIMLFVYGFTIQRLVLFIIVIVCGAFSLTCISIIFSSLSFWFNRTDIITDSVNNLMINFSTYPDGIFKGITRIIIFTIVPVGIINYIPVWIFKEFNIYLFIIVICTTILFIFLAFTIFYKGLKRYSSSNLMGARI